MSVDTQIDPAEAILAVIGVSAVLSKSVPKIGVGVQEEASKLPRKIERLANALTAGRLDTTLTLDLDHKSVLKNLSEQYQQDQFDDLADRFPPDLHDVVPLFVLRVGQVYQGLQQLIPRSAYASVAGITDLEPHPFLVHKFSAVYDVVQDPLRVFPLMAAGALLKSQVMAVRGMYPTLAAAIDEALTEAIITAKAARKTFELTASAEAGVKAWFGQPQTSPSLHRALQIAFQGAKDKPPEPHSDGRTSIVAKESLSYAQRSLYPEAK